MDLRLIIVLAPLALLGGWVACWIGKAALSQLDGWWNREA